MYYVVGMHIYLHSLFGIFRQSIIKSCVGCSVHWLKLFFVNRTGTGADQKRLGSAILANIAKQCLFQSEGSARLMTVATHVVDDSTRHVKKLSPPRSVNFGCFFKQNWGGWGKREWGGRGNEEDGGGCMRTFSYYLVLATDPTCPEGNSA